MSSGKVAAGLGGSAVQLGSFYSRNLQDAPVPLKNLSLLWQGLWSKEEGLGFCPEGKESIDPLKNSGGSHGSDMATTRFAGGQ